MKDSLWNVKGNSEMAIYILFISELLTERLVWTLCDFVPLVVNTAKTRVQSLEGKNINFLILVFQSDEELIRREAQERAEIARMEGEMLTRKLRQQRLQSESDSKWLAKEEQNIDLPRSPLVRHLTRCGVGWGEGEGYSNDDRDSKQTRTTKAALRSSVIFRHNPCVFLSIYLF